MNIKVIHSASSVFREADIVINVVQDLENHIINKSNHASATRGNHAVAYGFMSFRLTTPRDYHVNIKRWGEATYPQYRKLLVDNHRALGDWLLDKKALFMCGNVGIHVDSCQYVLDIFVFDDADVYIDDNLVRKGTTNDN